MIKMIITGAVVSKGANDGPAVKFSEKGDFARFRIVYKIYDTRAENNHRWINLTVKAFGDLCDRINKMDLKAGSYISLTGRYDEDTWEDEKTKAKKSMPVIILDEVEFCFSGSSKKTDGNQNATSEPQYPAQNYAAPPAIGSSRTGFPRFYIDSFRMPDGSGKIRGPARISCRVSVFLFC